MKAWIREGNTRWHGNVVLAEGFEFDGKQVRVQS